MKKFILLFIIGFLFLIPNVDAKDINVYLFYGDGCPHCAAMEEFFVSYLDDNDDVKLFDYEVWYNSNNQKLWEKVQKSIGVEAEGIPYLIIGDKVLQGYLTGYTDDKIEEYINYCRNNSYTDKAGVLLGVSDSVNVINDKDDKKDSSSEEKDLSKEYNLPVLGEVSAKNVSLPILAIVIGFVDGFNPCAMWILIFLISMLFTLTDRKKMWILGLTFIISSGLVYLLFMVSWLKVAVFANQVTFIRSLIAIFALVFGIYNVYRYFKTKDIGCDVTNLSSRKKIMTSIKSIVNNKVFVLSMLGIIVLSFSVNIIELLCSLGLPVVFTEILSLNDVDSFEKLIYLIIYIVFFIIDDLIIFIIAMKSLKIKAISNKYTKYSHLIGGLIMLLLGILMLIKPEWIMFNF